MSEAEELNNHNDPIVEDDEDDDDDEDDSNLNNEEKAKKRKERLEQNRISARESRKRKKTMIEELQRTVITLSRENKDLNERNESLRRQLMEIGSKVRSSNSRMIDGLRHVRDPSRWRHQNAKVLRFLLLACSTSIVQYEYE